jgi:hypothetical protein
VGPQFLQPAGGIQVKQFSPRNPLDLLEPTHRMIVEKPARI